MQKSGSHRKLISLIHRFEGSDRDLERVLGAARSTVWRIRNGKISNVEKYIVRLEAAIGDGDADQLDGVFEDLKLWVKESNELREILVSLHSVLQESATTP